MKRIILLALFLLGSISVQAQDLVSTLYGIQIGQYREVSRTVFGEPYNLITYESGREVEYFQLRPDSSAYVVIEYPLWNRDIIYSIQIVSPDPEIEPKFKGLTFGMPEEEVISVLGDPSRVDSGESVRHLEYFEKANYSVVINAEGRLISIKLKDNFYKFFPRKDVSKIPKFEEVRDVLRSNDNARIAEIISPEIEIYYLEGEKKILFFDHPWDQEIESDASGVFKVIQAIIQGIENVDYTDPEQFVQYPQRRQGIENPFHVIELLNETRIGKLVFSYERGRYVIWEIILKDGN